MCKRITQFQVAIFIKIMNRISVNIFLSIFLTFVIWQIYLYHSIIEQLCGEIKERLKLNMKQVRSCNPKMMYSLLTFEISQH